MKGEETAYCSADPIDCEDKTEQLNNITSPLSSLTLSYLQDSHITILLLKKGNIDYELETSTAIRDSQWQLMYGNEALPKT